MHKTEVRSAHNNEWACIGENWAFLFTYPKYEEQPMTFKRQQIYNLKIILCIIILRTSLSQYFDENKSLLGKKIGTYVGKKSIKSYVV